MLKSFVLFTTPKNMSIVATISAELKAAMKSGDTAKRDTLRFLQSALKNAAIESRQSLDSLDDAAVQAVVKRMAKQREESIAQYRAGGRSDLAAKEEAELVLLSAYLPKLLSREETEVLVTQTLATLGTVGPQDMGRVMQAVMHSGAGTLDGKLVRDIVAAKLAV